MSSSETRPCGKDRVHKHETPSRLKAPAAQFVVYAVLAALYARTRLLKMTGKKTYYREEKTE